MFNRKEIKKRGKELLKGNLLFFFVMILLTYAVSFIPVVGIIAGVIFGYFVSTRCLKIYKGDSQVPWFNFEVESFSTYIVMFLITIGITAGALIVVVTLLAILILVSASTGFTVGFIVAFIIYIAFAVCGIILSLMISFSPYIAIEYPRVGAWKTLTYSYKITKGNLWSIFVYILSFILWVILVVITFGIAIFYVQGYLAMSTVSLYKDLSAKSTDFTQSVSKFGYTV